jgi:hypothetical protein
MQEQPANQTTTQALGSTTVVFGWVEESRVQEVLHASDGFQTLLGVTLAGAGGIVAALVTLAAGVPHPGTLYLILAVTVTIVVVAGLFGLREYLRYRKVRRSLGAATAQVPVPVLLVTPGVPSFAVGGQQPFAVGGQQPITVRGQQPAAVEGQQAAGVRGRLLGGGPAAVMTAPSAATATRPGTTAVEVPTQEAAPALAGPETPPVETSSGAPEDTNENPAGAS